MRQLWLIGGLAAAIAFAATAPVAHAADGHPSIIHPIYAELPNAQQNEQAQRAFTETAARYKLRPVEVIDVPEPPAPKAPALVKSGVEKTRKLAFADALADLNAAAAEVATTGDAGLTTDELADLYLFRAMATEKADWREDRTVDPETRARAFEDYVRAALLVPNRVLPTADFPASVIEEWKRAVAEVARRPRGSIAVKASALAQIGLDGRPALPGPRVAFADLAYGDHHVTVEEPGRGPWGVVVPLSSPTFDVDAPARPALTLEDRVAAAHARRMDAKFALVAELKPSADRMVLELRLIDITGVRHDSATVPLAGEGGVLDAAVMRLDEEARRLDRMGLALGSAPPPEPAPPPVLVAQPPPKATFSDDPLAWARDRWPLFAAVGVMVATTLVLSIAVAADSPPAQR